MNSTKVRIALLEVVGAAISSAGIVGPPIAMFVVFRKALAILPPEIGLLVLGAGFAGMLIAVGAMLFFGVFSIPWSLRGVPQYRLAMVGAFGGTYLALGLRYFVFTAPPTGLLASVWLSTIALGVLGGVTGLALYAYAGRRALQREAASQREIGG